MATASVSVVGKRKRDDAALKSARAKRPAIRQEAKSKSGKGNATAADTHKRTKAQPNKPPGQAADVEQNLQPKAQAKMNGPKDPVSTNTVAAKQPDGDVYVQLVTGSYERVLHGISARIPRHLLQATTTTNGDSSEIDDANGNAVAFSDTFLFAAHTSSVRCLAISPSTESDKRFLATGSSDERVNVYSISTAPPTNDKRVDLPKLTSGTIAENPRNRSLGSLIHHDRAVTRLEFPAKGKLFSASEDNTIAISRTRDWTVLSSIKAPIPKPQGRPSGDTAAPGDTPAGVNDFAIHPSQKLMLSVGRGERCLRLWNLMTGKKAGVLNFDRSLLLQVGEGKYSSGEGMQVLWNGAGDAYVVGFERGAAVFGIDSEPQALIKPSPPTKLHQFRMLQVGDGKLLGASTEDGRILFYDLAATTPADGEKKLPVCTCVAQLGGRDAGVSGRVKDFEILSVQLDDPPAQPVLVVVTASSDGAVRLWRVGEGFHSSTASEKSPRQVGTLIGTLETGNRITCLAAFVLDGKADGKVEEDEDAAGLGAGDEDDSDDEE